MIKRALAYLTINKLSPLSLHDILYFDFAVSLKLCPDIDVIDFPCSAIFGN